MTKDLRETSASGYALVDAPKPKQAASKWAMTHTPVDVVFFAYSLTNPGEKSPLFLSINEMQEWCENN